MRSATMPGRLPKVPRAAGFLLTCLALAVGGSSGARAGDILRGGAAADQSRRAAAARANSGAEAADLARRTAQDRLARTSQVINALRARTTNASKASNASVPNGLAPGGLVVANPGNWVGANLPTQNGAIVNIIQTAQTAELFWESFNVGRGTILQFDQSAGGAEVAQWIAYNRVLGDSESRIVGSILAPGQVYLQNPNGIRFDAGARVEARTFVATTLPINSNLVQQGLLNNRDAQFLFSGLSVPGGSDGTPAFNPPAPPAATGRFGDVIVEAGALLSATTTNDGNGGRIMLVGANVENRGVIETPAGQTILAAGLQVGVAAHDSNDPSLRGLDVWVGDVGTYGGGVTNTGLIESLTGSITIVGRHIQQLGALESSTSVNLNGRIDVLASYGAVGNPGFDNVGGGGVGGPIFVNQFTGLLEFGPQSVTRILPDQDTTRTIPGTALPERSQINLLGQFVDFQGDAIVLAPNALVTARAGIWPYKDADGNRTTLDPSGVVETGLINFFLGSTQRFLFTGGWINMEPGSIIDVSGSTDVFVPLSHSILTVEFRGAELADSPLQRDGVLRGVPLVVDIRKTGTIDGRFWMGTPLGDVTGIANLIERNAAQLTAEGGAVELLAGGAITIREGATVDVSGGFFQHEGGRVQTSRLIYQGRLYDVATANPDIAYEGVFTGQSTRTHEKWGVSRTFALPLAPTGAYTQNSYVGGADAGSLRLQAAALAINGTLQGKALVGERQRDDPPSGGTLELVFESQVQRTVTPTDIRFLLESPVAPEVAFSRTERQTQPGDLFDRPLEALPFETLTRNDFLAAIEMHPEFGDFRISPELLTEQGFDHLTVTNLDGSVVIQPGAALDAGPRGSIVVSAANIDVRDDVVSAGGDISFTAHAISPYLEQTFELDNPAGAPSPAADPERGQFVLHTGVSLDASGLEVDDRRSNLEAFTQPLVTEGGSVTIDTYSAELQSGSVIDVSGGAVVDPRGEISYGNAGSITILTGRDQTFNATTGGTLKLDTELRGFSGAEGGSLSIQALLVHIGFRPIYQDSLVLEPDFFQRGGFTSYTITGIGRAIENPVLVPGAPDPYAPAVTIEDGVVIQPMAVGLLARRTGGPGGSLILEERMFPDGLRRPVDLHFEALGSDDEFTVDVLEARGDIVVGARSRILAEPGSTISFTGDTVTLLGEVSAPGGAIIVEGAGAFPVPPTRRPTVAFATPTVYIGPEARLSTVGTVVYAPDPFGRRVGTLYDGGTISISGNILAEAGASLDVSGSSAEFDVHPTALGIGGVADIPITSGLTEPPWRLRTTPVTLYSSGGVIELTGSEMLLSDAELIGRAGGPGAEGGTLRIFSGRFYPQTAVLRTSADINLVVRQSGNFIPNSPAIRGIGRPVLDAAGTPIQGMGYFAADRFAAGGFDNLDLGAEYFETGDPFPFGGNVRFEGNVSIAARGSIRLAFGGVVEAQGNVNLTAPYIAVGQPFRAPLHPDDNDTLFFRSPAVPTREYVFAPTPGTGSLQINADLIDVGTVSFERLSTVNLSAPGGDIRGNGTVQLAGDLTLEAAQIYPTTLGQFTIFAYDRPGRPGSVTIVGSGSAPVPLSAGGTIGIFASQIHQGGTLRAPFGQIVLGWDGITDLDPSDADIDGPINRIAGAATAVPLAASVVLGDNSITSVSGVDDALGAGILVPYGLSPDGLAWIDPSGVNITASGLPAKGVSILGDSISTSSSSVIDVRGGGDLYAFRWVPGQGGSIDRTAGTPAAWNSGVEYEAGDQAVFNGRTWSARLGNTGETPVVGQFWSEVPQSFAILPGYTPGFAPHAPFNTSINASALGGDTGYVDANLRLGEQVRLDGIPGLPGGTYTLLPARYALLPGAYLITPTSEAPIGTLQAPNRSYFVNGAVVNSLNRSRQASPVLTRYEVSTSDVLRDRAEYADYGFNAFARDAAARLEIANVQRLPADGGGVVFQGTSALSLFGMVLAHPTEDGRGGYVDIASAADIYIVGGGGSAPAGARAVLRSEVLNSWTVESFLIGGQRGQGDSATPVTVRTGNIIVDNPGSSLRAPDITLVSRGSLTLTPGSSVVSTGPLSSPVEIFSIVGDGTALRVSGDPMANITRTGITGSTVPIMTIGAGASIAGAGVLLESTYATSLDPSAQIRASALTLGSGQISVVFPGYGGPLSGSLINPHLVLSGSILGDVQAVDSLVLRSYSSIDLYGSGSFGSPSLESLTFEGAGLRGYAQLGLPTNFTAANIEFTNPSAAAFPAAPPGSSGSLAFNSGVASFGSNAFRVAGYDLVSITGTQGVLGTSTGSFAADNALTINAPMITGARGSTTALSAGAALILNGIGGQATVTPGLGASISFTGTQVTSSAAIVLPSGLITMRALTGDVLVSGLLDVSGGSQAFFDQIRFADAGNISLQSSSGNVQLLPGSVLSIAAAAGGGDAGTLEILSPGGGFVFGGSLLGSAGASGEAGSFSLDAGAIGPFSILSNALTSGGFFKSQTFRIRNGDIVLDGMSRASDFSFSADRGSLTVSGIIDASGITGGSIALVARDSVVLQSGSRLTVAGQIFNSAGKGGVVQIEAGSQSNGAVNAGAVVDIQSGSMVDLSVMEFGSFVPGDYTTPGSAAFFGRFQGTLKLRGARLAGNDVGVNPILGNILGPSSILVEGYRLYDLTGSGVMNRTLRDSINADNSAYITAGEVAMRAKVLAGNPAAAALDPLLVIAPGVEIINRTGDLTLGLANPTGSTNLEARSTADWDLSGWRYGTRGAPGVLTLRSQGDLVFNNTLSDGFTPVGATLTNGNSSMWLARPQTINSNLPANTQSWSYRLTAGADFDAAGVSFVLQPEALQALQPGKGSVLVGEFYPAVPNSNTGGISPGVGASGITSGSIRISTTTADQGTRYEVIRTGTGSIVVAAGRDVQLRNQFATIYTAGVATPVPTTAYQANDFRIPVIPTSSFTHPSQGNLGAVQQAYQPFWTLAGGDISVSAGRNIGRYTLFNGVLTVDSSKQVPNNWLYRRSYVDDTTGLFASDGGVDGTLINTVTDTATSTTWWIDFSNFFEGIGALGGGNISLGAGEDIINIDAAIPTNARMPGRDPSTGQNVAPDPAKLVEWGGGDLRIDTGGDVSGGVYYVQRGVGTIKAGGAITTNQARTPSRYLMGVTTQPADIVQSQNPSIFDSRTWLPITLMVGNAWFDVAARGDILLGPAVDTFLLPQGLNNRFWYKTYFRNSADSSGVSVSSFGGGITHRYEVILPGFANPIPTVQGWLSQNVYAGAASSNNSSFLQPWIRLAEQEITNFSTVMQANAPTLLSTAFAGSLDIVGSGSLFPSPTGTLELLASDGITGLNSTGRSTISGQSATVWTYSTLNLSDADPNSFPTITRPVAYQQFVGRSVGQAQLSNINALANVSASLRESGATTGASATIERKRQLHAQGILHKADDIPARIYAAGGDITGLTFFSPKFLALYADRDLTDVSIYIQNTRSDDISIVSAGRDIIPFNENSAIRTTANDITLQNVIRSTLQNTLAGGATTALAGDIQISGPGILEVLAGRNLDLGTGANFSNGTGFGITSVANARNPFLPSTGASIVAMAGIGGPEAGGPALGLSESAFDFVGFIQTYESEIENFGSNYLLEIDAENGLASLSEEQQAIVALEYFYELLRQAGIESAEGGTYDIGLDAIATLIPNASTSGELFTRSRDIRTISGGSITLGVPAGGLTMASDIIGNPQTPPGIVTEFGGRIDVFTLGDVDIGQARIFTLRGGDLTIWSSEGDIAAGNAPKTVVTAPPTRVVIDSNSAALQTDLGGLATGGGIGVLASVEGVEPGNVSLIAPQGVVDAGDAGIRATGDITISAVAVLNADNISAAGASVGVPSAPAPAAANITGLTSGTSSTAATNQAAEQLAATEQPAPTEESEEPSIIQVEVLGYGGGESGPPSNQDEDREEEEEER